MIQNRIENSPIKSDELIIPSGTLLEIYSNPEGVYSNTANGSSFFTKIVEDISFASLIQKTQDMGEISNETITFIKINANNHKAIAMAKENPFK